MEVSYVTGDVTINLSASSGVESTPAVMRTLPRGATAFTGRQNELKQLLAAVSEVTRTGLVVGISAIDGMPGVGKTAFAVHAARRLARRFPDGQLFLDLHAHTAGQRPTAPIDALGTLLSTMGVSPRLIPRDLRARSAMWRERLAGKRILIVLDDAAGHDQVRPLLPDTAGCLVLVTSRHRLAGLAEAEPLTLGTLPPAGRRGAVPRPPPRPLARCGARRGGRADGAVRVPSSGREGRRRASSASSLVDRPVPG